MRKIEVFKKISFFNIILKKAWEHLNTGCYHACYSYAWLTLHRLIQIIQWPKKKTCNSEVEISHWGIQFYLIDIMLNIIMKVPLTNMFLNVFKQTMLWWSFRENITIFSFERVTVGVKKGAVFRGFILWTFR